MDIRCFLLFFFNFCFYFLPSPHPLTGHSVIRSDLYTSLQKITFRFSVHRFLFIFLFFIYIFFLKTTQKSIFFHFHDNKEETKKNKYKKQQIAYFSIRLFFFVLFLRTYKTFYIHVCTFSLSLFYLLCDRCPPLAPL